MKIKKSRVETSAPTTLEDLRAKVVLAANHFLGPVGDSNSGWDYTASALGEAVGELRAPDEKGGH